MQALNHPKTTEWVDSFLKASPNPDTHTRALFIRAQKYIRWISWIPGLQMVAVCNSLSFYAGEKDSDIDLFIVTKPNRMWLARFLITGVFHSLGVRRHGTAVAGRFCLSFFCTTDALDFQKIAIEDDVYLHAWIRHLKPIWTKNQAYEVFLQANAWVNLTPAQKEKNLQFLLPNPPKKSPPHALKKKWWEEMYIFEALFNWTDTVLRWIFEPKTIREWERLGKPWGIQITENMLKFHRNDARIEIREEWKGLLQKKQSS